MSISAGDIKGLFTKKLISVYQNKATATSFLRSFFPKEISDTKNVSIEVRQGTNKIAVDVIRGSEGNITLGSKSSEKIWTPPYFKEKTVASSMDLYDRVFGDSAGNASAQDVASYVKELADLMVVNQDKIARAIELQCAQIFDDGIVVLNQGDNIDFKRKAGSIIDVSGTTPWSTGTNDPANDLKAAAEFIRSESLTTDFTFNAIMGGDALDALINNDTFQAKSDLKDIDLNSIGMPEAQAGATGAVFHGVASAGSYKFRIWTYPQQYTNSGGTKTDYIDSKKVIVLPMAPTFKLAYAAVPALRTDQATNSPVSIAHTPGEYVLEDYIDVTREAHFFAIKSAPLAVPVEVNAIATLTVLA